MKKKAVLLTLGLAPGLLVGAGRIIGGNTINQPVLAVNDTAVAASPASLVGSSTGKSTGKSRRRKRRRTTGGARTTGSRTTGSRTTGSKTTGAKTTGA